MRIAMIGLVAASICLPSTAGWAAGDAGAGATVFNRCAICHSNTKGAPNKIGPNLFGIVGSKAATVPNFNFSAAMKNSGITWTPDKLDAYLKSPAAFLPGNRMAFAGIANDQQRADVVAYLATLK